MYLRFLFSLALLCLTAVPHLSHAFCGFYVAKADTQLFNKASKVVLVRDGDRTVITMSSDYQGDPSEFAMVIPVPTLLEREQINVTENAIVDHLDAYTAPRLVEYFDSDPCQQVMLQTMARSSAVMEDGAGKANARAKSLGVTIEAEYTVGEYDIIVLSAKESDGLTTWLNDNDYKMPKGAERTLQSYIKQGTKFFLAKVNLEEKQKLGTSYLRPLQIAFESPKFMLPIRLGTLNADGAQELFVFTLTRKGRVETTNYRTVKIPTDKNLPLYVKEDFNKFYPAMFDTAVEKEDMKAVFMEYAWDMNWCDPCAADPLSPEELRKLGVFWIKKAENAPQQVNRRLRAPQPAARDVFVTRLHVRYTADTFPEDLKFQETQDRSNFQGRYILQHPWKEEATCTEADAYRRQLKERFDKEAQTLANLTGWDIADIRERMKKTGQDVDSIKPKDGGKWWLNLWN